MSLTTTYPGLKFQVQEAIYDPKSMLDEQNFYHQRQGKPSELTKTMTYILGSQQGKYPLSVMTMGGSGFGNMNSAVELDDVQFTYPIVGKMNKAVEVGSTEYSAGDKPGAGDNFFFITFRDNWIKRFYHIRSENGTLAYVLEDPEYTGGGYRYKVQLSAGDANSFCLPSELDPGKKWIDLFTGVAESESRSTESKMVMPGKFKNQMGFMRAGFSWAGNAPNKMMNITVTDSKGRTTQSWMDYAMWQFEDRWLDEKEHMLWYSQYNRRADGSIALKDLLTSKVIPMGSGVLEQIINKSTYTKLTYKGLMNRIGDALYGQSDTAGMSITLMGGMGARREFHQAMADQGISLLGGFGNGNIADKFVTGSGRNLALGGFFDSFYHIDGYVVKFKYNPVFDYGRVAMVGPTHPETGLPLESYRMVFLDDNDVDGGPNIKHVVQKGRAFMDGVVKGLTPMPKSLETLLGNSGGQLNGKLLSSVQDKGEYTRLASGGIQIMRANRCFDMQCVAGL